MDENMQLASQATPDNPDVVRLADLDDSVADNLLQRFGLLLARIEPGWPIPGSYWGDEEAGLSGNRLLARPDTPVHSILHEASHFVCMDPARRDRLHENAGGDHDEENAVCYLQILLADYIPALGRRRMMLDMDTWGYTFRLGSAAAWFAQDADDARQWLAHHALIDAQQRPTWSVRGH